MGDAISGTRPKFNDPALNQEIMRLRAIGHVANLGFLAFEYMCVAAVIGSVWLLGKGRVDAGLSWGWDLPVLATAVVLMGGIQHRLAGLGHEAAHYSLLRNKFLNDLIGDVFCFFPLLGTIHFYRLFHLAHHQYTNDPERDPDLVTLGGSKMVDRFPMQRGELIRTVYLRAFTNPWAFVNYVMLYMDLNTICRTGNVYVDRLGEAGAGDRRLWPRLGVTLGAMYLGGLVVGHWVLSFWVGRGPWLIYEGVGGPLLVMGAALVLPDGAFFQSPFRQPYSGRFGGVLRLVGLTWFHTALIAFGGVFGDRVTLYFWTLWVLPLGTTFPFFLWLRDIYQHTNADNGRLTNTRVFYPDPFTRWAVFVYGQDMHLPHHLFPAIPHYRLARLHQLLKDRHSDYAALVVECHGTFWNREGQPTILDTLTKTRS